MATRFAIVWLSLPRHFGPKRSDRWLWEWTISCAIVPILSASICSVTSGVGSLWEFCLPTTRLDEKVLGPPDTGGNVQSCETRFSAEPLNCGLLWEIRVLWPSTKSYKFFGFGVIPWGKSWNYFLNLEQKPHRKQLKRSCTGWGYVPDPK